MSLEVPIILLLIAIPLYFISLWVMNRRQYAEEGYRKYRAIIPALFLSPVVYVLILIIWIAGISYYPDHDFDREQWQMNIDERYKMTEDIIESRMLIGRTREGVIEILGREGMSVSGEYSIYYEIGHIPGLFNIDPSFLYIDFHQGVVVEVS